MTHRFKFRYFNKICKSMRDVTDEPLNKIIRNENLILMQCTGVTDKFSQIIYEGDIVKCMTKGASKWVLYREIKWDEGKFLAEWPGADYLNDQNYGRAYHFDKFMDLPELKCFYNYNVVGNIYQNPELEAKMKEMIVGYPADRLDG